MSSSNPLCFSTQPGRGVVGDVVDGCFTHKFLHYYRIFKKVEYVIEYQIE